MASACGLRGAELRALLVTLDRSIPVPLLPASNTGTLSVPVRRPRVSTTCMTGLAFSVVATIPRPVATTVTRSWSSMPSSNTVPQITVASGAVYWRMVFITSLYSLRPRVLLAVMLTSTPRAPDSSIPSSSGLATAPSAAMRARSTPAATAEPIMALPISCITVRTSSKSTLTRPGTLMISAMPPTALRSTLSAVLNASR